MCVFVLVGLCWAVTSDGRKPTLGNKAVVRWKRAMTRVRSSKNGGWSNNGNIFIQEMLVNRDSTSEGAFC